MKGKRKTLRKKSIRHEPVFTEKEYQSNDGFLTKIWGPPCWHFIHTMSFNYPVNPTEIQKKTYRDFILSLRSVLPCGKCRDNLEKNFKRLPLTMKEMKNRDTFSRYIYELHEVVNTMLLKKSNLTFEQVRDRYEHFRSQCSKKKNKTLKKQPEKGCTEPIYQKTKSKCLLKIVPDTEKCETLEIDDKCLLLKKNS